MPAKPQRERRKNQITPIPSDLQQITDQLLIDFDKGSRVYFRDAEREDNWYFGRIIHVNWKMETETFDVKDNLGMIVKDIKRENLKQHLPEDGDAIKLPKKRSLPDSRFAINSPVSFTMSGAKYEGKIVGQKSETFIVEVDGMNGATENVHFSQTSLNMQTQKAKSPKAKKTQKTRKVRRNNQRLIKNVKCLEASSSDKRNPHTNLDFGNKNWWCTMWGKSNGWLTFDLGEDYVLKKVEIYAVKGSAPRQCTVEYLNAAGNLMFGDVLKFTYQNTALEQEFLIENDVPVRYVRLQILDNWNEKYVGINRIHFHGDAASAYDPEVSQEEKEQEKKASLEKSKRRHQLMKWEIGDRVDYQWDDSGKWYTGRILHVNDNYTYLIKDDYNFVKDHITPEQVRQTKKRRKPRRLKASRKTTMQTIEEYMPLNSSPADLENRANRQIF